MLASGGLMAEDERSLGELAELMKVSLDAMRKAVQRGTLEARRVGPIWVSTPEAVARWLAGPYHRPGRPRKKLVRYNRCN